MTRLTASAILLGAAILEAGGDALMREGLSRHGVWQRGFFFAVAAIVLFAYGWTVNAPPWDFGRLLGTYIVFFFVVAQLLSWWMSRQPPSPARVCGGLLIAAGGLVITMARA